MYIFVFCCSLSMSWLMLDNLLGGGTLDTLEVHRAPSFCRAEGSFLSVGKSQVRHRMFYYFIVVFIFEDETFQK